MPLVDNPLETESNRLAADVFALINPTKQTVELDCFRKCVRANGDDRIHSVHTPQLINTMCVQLRRSATTEPAS